MQFGGIRTSGAAALRHFSGQDWNHDVCIYRFNYYYLRDQMSISIFFFFFFLEAVENIIVMPM